MSRESHIPKHIRIKNGYLLAFLILGVIIGPYIGYLIGHVSIGIVIGVAGGMIIGSVSGVLAERAWFRKHGKPEEPPSP